MARLADGLAISFVLRGGANRVLLRGTDISADIRTPEISDGASRVSALPEVRAALLDLQRRLAARGGVVVEGRDIGTVVFPDAEAKFFLTGPTGHCGARAATAHRDSTRPVAPLRKADDAVEIDSTRLSLEAVVDRMVEVVRQRSGR